MSQHHKNTTASAGFRAETDETIARWSDRHAEAVELLGGFLRAMSRARFAVDSVERAARCEAGSAPERLARFAGSIVARHGSEAESDYQRAETTARALVELLDRGRVRLAAGLDLAAELLDRAAREPAESSPDVSPDSIDRSGA